MIIFPTILYVLRWGGIKSGSSPPRPWPNRRIVARAGFSFPISSSHRVSFSVVSSRPMILRWTRETLEARSELQLDLNGVAFFDRKLPSRIAQKRPVFGIPLSALLQRFDSGRHIVSRG